MTTHSSTATNAATRRLEGLLAGCRLPVISAPMFLVSGPDLVVAACAAGVIGSFPTMNCREVETLEKWFAEIDARLAGLRASGLSPAPWAANLVVHSTNQRLPRDLELVSRFKPPMVITALLDASSTRAEAILGTMHDLGIRYYRAPSFRYDYAKELEPQLEALRPRIASLVADRKSTRLNSSHTDISRMPSSA